MKITQKHKIKDLKKLGVVINLDSEFMDKVKAFSVPETIAGIKLKHRNEISLSNMLLAWNIKSEEQLMQVTAKAYGLNKDKIQDYPLIDFIRLTIDLQEVAKESADLFSSLKRTNKDAEIEDVLQSFTTSNLGIVDRFVTRSNGAYTHDTAAECSWLIVYEAFKVDTLEYDKQIAINEIMEKRHGNK